MTLQPLFDQYSTNVETRLLVFISKISEKHLWKSDIFSKGAGRKNQLPGLSVNGTLVGNGLMNYFFFNYFLNYHLSGYAEQLSGMPLS